MRRGRLLPLALVAGAACNQPPHRTRKDPAPLAASAPAPAPASAGLAPAPPVPFRCARDEWAHYGHDAARSFASAECIEGPLTLLWKAQPTTPVKERAASFEHAVATEDGLFVVGLRGKSSMLHGLGLDGSPRWEHDTRTDLHFACWPMVAHGLAGMNDDGAFFLDLTTGKIRINQGLDSWGQLAADGERFYWTNTWHVHGPALFLGAFSQAGEALWKQSKYGGSSPMDMMDDLGGVALEGGAVYQVSNYKFASFSGVFAFDAATGKPRWSKNGAPVGYPSAGQGQVFVVERVQRERRLVARSQENGETRWSAALKGALGAAPALGGGLVVVGTDKGELVAFDAGSGQERWRFESGVKHAPVVGNETSVAIGANERVVFTVGKEVVLLDLKTGAVQWRGEVAGAAVHSPILAGGRLYVVAGGELLALSGVPPSAP